MSKGCDHTRCRFCVQEDACCHCLTKAEVEAPEPEPPAPNVQPPICDWPCAQCREWAEARGFGT